METSIDSTQTQADYPLTALLTITHSQNEKVDVQSVRLEGKPLEVSLVKETPMTVSSNTVVSIYQFELPPQKKGLYVLPPLSVKVGNQTYQSLPSTYSVRGEEENRVAPATSPPLFRLEAKVEGETTLYPGQRTKLIYQISFNHNIDLTRSVLPFVPWPAFQKIGDVQIQDSQQGELTIQELSQEVEAAQIGPFSFGPAFVEGHAYTLQGSQKIYAPMLLHAETPVIPLEVKPLPRMGQPPSFTGALGRIKVQGKLLSPSSLQVGDRLLLQIQMEGVQPLADLTLPPLNCQPGFSGFFQMSDLPPQAEVKGSEKIFQVELKVMTPLIHQIPPIEVSSFDPETEDYHLAYTSPIPLSIQSSLSSSWQVPPLIRLFPLPFFGKWPSPPLPPLALPIDPVLDPPIDLVKEGNDFYEKGGAATAFEKRKFLFNQALLLYHLAEKEMPFSDLYRGLGDLYFQLGEYPWAILFYERSLKKDPRSSLALSHLKKAKEELDLPTLFHSSHSFSFLFFLPFLIGFVLICFIFFRKIAKIGVILFAFFFFYLLIQDFSTLIEGILIEPTGLYRVPDRHPPPLTSPLLMPGSKVEILQVMKEGGWLKIRNQEGSIGYIPAESIRLI